MTTTPGYIKKCEMAEEIQAMRAPEIEDASSSYDGSTEVSFNLWAGDCFACKHIGSDNHWQVLFYGNTSVRPVIYRGTPENNWSAHLQYSKDDGENAVVTKIIWLPRLDQLLDLLSGIEISPREVTGMFSSDREEKLLTVLMRNKFGKKWDGEKWVAA